MEYDVRDAVETFEVGGFVFFGGGFVKRGVRPNPPNPLWLRACRLIVHSKKVMIPK